MDYLIGKGGQCVQCSRVSPHPDAGDEDTMITNSNQGDDLETTLYATNLCIHVYLKCANSISQLFNE